MKPRQKFGWMDAELHPEWPPSWFEICSWLLFTAGAAIGVFIIVGELRQLFGG